MNESVIQNQLKYTIANEQYLKPLLESGKISEDVYNDVLENLYNNYEVWRTGRIKNPSISANKKKRESKQNLAELHPGFISLTELARGFNFKSSGYAVQCWLRDKNTVNFLSLWERKHNENFTEFTYRDRMTVTQKVWIKETNSVGIASRNGKYGGTYASKEIAMHFMCWLSADMMLNVIEKYLEVMSDEESN